MTDCKDVLDDFLNKMEPVFNDFDTCTIKLPPEVKKEYNDMFDNACTKMVNRIEKRGRKAEKK